MHESSYAKQGRVWMTLELAYSFIFVYAWGYDDGKDKRK